MRIIFIIFLSYFILSCATTQRITNNSPIISGGKTEAMKFNMLTDTDLINTNNPKVKSIARVAKQNQTAKIIILYPQKADKLANKLFDTFQQLKIDTMKPLQSTILNSGVSDEQNIYVYLSFQPLLMANLEESTNARNN
jgi:5S rRNA maturation endonuclease (ribonuclease M5)